MLYGVGLLGVDMASQGVNLAETEVEMAGFFKKLFGGGQAQQAAVSGEPDEIYKDIAIHATPESDGGQWRVSGTIVKMIDGAAAKRRFMRADLLPSEQEAKTVAIGKAKLIIDQNGDMLWQGDLERPC